MISLNSTTRKLQILLGGAVSTNQLPVTVHFREVRSTETEDIATGAELNNTNSTTAVDIAAAPASGRIKTIESISVHNRDTASATVTIRYNDNATTYALITVALAAGDNLFYEQKSGWTVINSTGNTKSAITENSQDAIGSILTDTAFIDFTYDDATPSISATTKAMDFVRAAANPGDTDTLWMDDGTTYAAGTMVAPMPTVFLDEVSFGTPGAEQGSITVNGSTYDALVKINEFEGTRDAQLILHRHHTTNSISGTLLFAKSATADSSHAAVADAERLGEIIAVGHDGTDYATAASIRFVVDGTPGSNDMPGAILFLTSPDGSQTLAERFRVGPTGELGIGGETYGTAGQVLTSGGSGVAPSWEDRLTLSTVQATTSGTSKEFTGIPAGTKEVVVMYHRVSFGTDDNLAVQLGTAGGYKTTGYEGGYTYVTSTTATQSEIDATIICGLQGGAGSTASGKIIFTLMDAANDIWSWHIMSYQNGGTTDYTLFGAGTVSLAAELTKLKLYGYGGQTFDAGSVNIAYR